MLLHGEVKFLAFARKIINQSLNKSRTPPKVEALNTQHKVEKSTTTRENRVHFVFFRREEAKGRSKF